jgi:predicted metalloprotease with PDZ domain
LILASHLHAADTGPTLSLEVDARDLPRRLLHADLRVPCQAGKLRLWYPKWVPGTHAPSGPIQNIGGLRIETGDGKTLEWRRDDVELYCVTCTVPAGATEVRVRLDYICNEASVGASGHSSYGNASLGVVNWSNCLVYPEGPSADATRVHLRLQLPKGWSYATALETAGQKEGLVDFRTGSLRELVDCPLIAGEHLRSIKLDTGSHPPAYLDIASEAPSALQLEQRVIDAYAKVVTEACTLFGSAPYPEYHFLVTCSNELSYYGLEHRKCSVNGVAERDLIDDARRKGWIANLLPHEYVHSWCGKYRQPAGMCTPDFQTPLKTSQLWVYEGLTEYLGEILLVRSGLITDKEYVEMLANNIAVLRRQEGRRWRPLEDTAIANYILRSPSKNWHDLRRGQDFYYEGMLLWLEADAIIRETTRGKRSLDDFCKKFFGQGAGKGPIVPYEPADIFRTLGEVAEYDWEQFFTRRISATQEALPLDVVERLGYRMQYALKPSAYLEYLQTGPRGNRSIAVHDSLGLSFSEDGKILDVVPRMPGDKAGLASGMQVIGVNSKKFSRQRLYDAVADSVTRRKIELLLLDGDNFRTVALDYADGPRYLELVRNPSRSDILSDILKPTGPKR